jgi:hypothetical protein
MTDVNSLIIKSPDLSKLKEVIIDNRTRIYIPPDADVEEAKERFNSKIRNARQVLSSE